MWQPCWSYCAEQWPSLGPCSVHLGIPSPSLPLLAPRTLVLALLHFHLSAQVSLVHVSATTDVRWFFCSPRLLRLSPSLGSAWVPIAVLCCSPKRRGDGVPHAQSQNPSLAVWEGTGVQEGRAAWQACARAGLTAVSISKTCMSRCPLAACEPPRCSAWKSPTINTS